jgi:hypothetical protein
MKWDSGDTREYKYLLYNEYYNENVTSPNKINETIFIALLMKEYSKEYSITTQGSIITIVYTSENKNAWKEINTTILTFDQTSKRLKYFTTVSIYKDNYVFYRTTETLRNNFEFEYDINDRLVKIYSIYNNEKILVKHYYYDGEIHEFEKPYYSDLKAPSLEEIVVYDNNILKYYIRLSGFSIPESASPRGVEDKNETTNYILFEYDEKKNEIRQIKYYGNSKYRNQDIGEIVEYDIQNSVLDENLNWIEIIATALNNSESNILTRRITRKIEY